MIRSPIFILLLSLLTQILSTPSPLKSTTRIATYDDISSSFSLVYNLTPNCPDTLTFSTAEIDTRQVALLPSTSILHDNNQCSASADMAFVSEATIRQSNLLTQLDLAGFRTSLNANPNANALVSGKKATGLLVGWIDEGLTCDEVSYPTDTIYFIVREQETYKISVARGEEQKVISIPPLMRALLIVPPDSNVCLLIDEKSNANQQVTLTETDSSGEEKVLTLLPGGVQTPSTSTSTSTSSSTSSSTSTTAGIVASTPTDSSTATATSTSTTASETPTSSPTASPLPTPEAPVAPIPETDTSAIPTPSISPTPSDGTASVTPEPSIIVVTPAPAPDTEGSITAPVSGGVVEDGDSDTTATPDGDDGSACFPASATVHLASGQTLPIHQLSIGDTVLTPTGPSDVIMFTHHSRYSHSKFVSIVTDSGHSLLVSPGHYVTVNNKLVQADRLNIGDELYLMNGSRSSIVSIDNVYEWGLYNPQTVSGSIFVNDIAVSTYTTAVNPLLAHHVLLKPVRWLYYLVPELFTKRMTSMFVDGAPRWVKFLPSGAHSVEL